MSAAAARPLPLLGALAGALVISAALIWLASGEAIAMIAFVGGIAVFLAAGLAIARMRPVGKAEEVATPDWSVTVAAIERPGEAVAIVDRANRLVCANTAFSDWFGAASAPPNLPLDRAGLETLARAAREAWRDGQGAAESVESADGTASWSARAERAGRGAVRQKSVRKALGGRRNAARRCGTGFPGMTFASMFRIT